ncbi:Transcription factor DIVARICATA [Olea europaea subsp. europaea]|uniref:Transcription factor DIVARICATA n=1 Tax=Olea europaea subsp. europaea TaxID=158383 RepID=A0A8S0VAG7_OLEEU|nr:Transcription factor DIVARICATA [Olea europaea subsp. europaea]
MMVNVHYPRWNSAPIMTWKWFENKLFEKAILMYPDGVENRWEKIANWVPGSRRTMSRLSLKGLSECAKGDWKAISRNFVSSRTPSQIASHAKKYFIRLADTKTSIYDIALDADHGAIVCRGGYNMTDAVNGGVTVSPQTNFPTHVCYNMESTVNGGAMVPPSTDFLSDGGYNLTASENDAMVPPSIDFPSRGGYNMESTVNGVAMVPPPTNFLSDGGYNLMANVNGGAMVASVHQFS